MQRYELLYIIKNNYSDEQIPEITKRVTALITSAAPNASITAQNLLGRRRLTYPIHKETSGCYGVVEFEMEEKNIQDLNRELALKEDILRHLIVTRKEQSEEEHIRQEKLREKIHLAQSQRQKREEKIPDKTLVQKPEELTKKEKTAPEKLEQLEEKLDEILKRDIVE